jgi:hypothetical protein
MVRDINIILSETAFQQLCFCALEAYAIKKLGQPKGQSKYLEVFGLLWGSFSKLEQENCNHCFYRVEFIGADTSALQKRNEVTRNEDSLVIKRDLTTSFWPHLRFLGDFHTHPYRYKDCDAKKIENEKLYEFSTADRKDIEKNSEFWRKHKYRVGLVCTIVDLKRAARVDKHLNDSTLVAGLGNYKLWIKAYYANYRKNQKIVLSDDVYLSCPSLLGIEEYTKFGRHSRGKHIEGSI